MSDTELADNHYRVVDGDRLLWSAAARCGSATPRRYVQDACSPTSRRTYPQLGKVEAEYAWTGTLGTTVHRMPQIGELSPGVWLLSGFGGQGINTTAMGGEIVARAIVDGGQTWRLFQPFDLVWAGGRLGRAAVQTAYWYQPHPRAREGLLARRASPGASAGDRARRRRCRPASRAERLGQAEAPAAQVQDAQRPAIRRLRVESAPGGAHA